jgi:hypothetical protein
MNRALHGSLKSWNVFVAWRKGARALLLKIFRKLDSIVLNKAVLQWKFFLMELKRSIEEREVLLAKRGIIRNRTLKKIKEDFRGLIKASWAALRLVVIEARAVSQKTQRLTLKFAGRAQKVCWSQWQSYHTMLKARKKAIGRSGMGIYRRAIARGFSTWLVHCLEWKCEKVQEDAREKSQVLQQQTAVIVELSNFIFSHLGLPIEPGTIPGVGEASKLMHK